MRKLKFHIAHSHKEAEDYDIEQMRSMSTDERFLAAMKLRERAFGKDSVKVRNSGFYCISSMKNKNE